MWTRIQQDAAPQAQQCQIVYFELFESTSGASMSHFDLQAISMAVRDQPEEPTEQQLPDSSHTQQVELGVSILTAFSRLAMAQARLACHPSGSPVHQLRAVDKYLAAI